MAKKRGDEHKVETRPVAFRLRVADYEAYQARCTAAGLTPSQYFRAAVLSDVTQITARPSRRSRVDERLRLLSLNRASNGIAKLAERAAADHTANILDSRAYEVLLYQLEVITVFLKATVSDAD